MCPTCLAKGTPPPGFALLGRRQHSECVRNYHDARDVRKRKNGEYEVAISYTCTFSTLGWVIGVIGLFFILGLLVIIAPITLKSEVSNRVGRALREMEE